MPSFRALQPSMLRTPSRRGPEPNATAIHVTPARFGSVPKAYVECLRDKALPVELQRQMASNSECRIAASLDTDHSPFFSMPRELVASLLDLAR